MPIVIWWKDFWEHAQFWDAFWPSVWGALVGAAMAFFLENRYRNRERMSREVGECNKLVFILGQMLSALEDINESLFENARKKLGRKPEWSDIGGLEGAPTSGPAFIIGEYTFLLEDRDPKSLAPYVLGKIYTTEANFKATLKRLEERTRLWHEYNEERAALQFARGEDAMQNTGVSIARKSRIRELTTWLAEDIPESIVQFRKLLPELNTILAKRYPKRQFIRLWSNSNPSAPPL